ncbi:hypothetical protein VTI28DRAFT_7433 [Corynascus sepedonium]
MEDSESPILDPFLLNSLSLSDEFSQLALQHTQHGSSSTSPTPSFVPSPRLTVPELAEDAPMTPTAGESCTPQTLFPNQETDPSFSTNLNISAGTGRVKKEYRCDWPKCKSREKVFSSKSLLKKHRNNHIRPRECEYCNYAAPERKDLARHMRTHHCDQPGVLTNRRIWKEMIPCLYCGVRQRADNLKGRHLRTCKARPATSGHGDEGSE